MLMTHVFDALSVNPWMITLIPLLALKVPRLEAVIAWPGEFGLFLVKREHVTDLCTALGRVINLV